MGKIILFFALALLLCACSPTSYLSSGDTSLELENEKKEPEDIAEPTEEIDVTGFVQIYGAVNAPGVYEIGKDTRLFSVIEAAGGLREDAAFESVNMAQVLSDGASIKVLTRDEYDNGLSESAAPGTSGDGRVNINTADVERLKTLRGIGDSKADMIIEYREANGSFSSIEDLMNIPGIKEGVFNKIKDDITV